MKESGSTARNNRLFVEFNILCWIVVFLISFLLTTPNLHDGVKYALLRMSIPVSMCLMFYSNFLWLVPEYFLKKKYRTYVGINLVMTLVLGVLVNGAMSVQIGHMESVRNGVGEMPGWPLMTALVTRNFLTIILSGAIALLLKLSMKWQIEERKRKEMEVQKAEADLKLLSNQIHPHFLLNTLNNIYALVAIDPSKAQKAVMSLSHLLRRMLYGNQTPRIAIQEEIDLLQSYINLMSIRQQKNVSIETDFQVVDPNVYVAPNIFISLVENAFKHGVSPTKESSVKVSLHASAEKIVFCTENTNYPKTANDKSGNGIGLHQVEVLLKNAYGTQYEWTHNIKTDTNIYISKIMLYDTKMCHH